MIEGPHRFTYDGAVTDGQRAYYEENGFIVFGNVLSAEEVETIREDAKSLESRTLAGDIPPSDIDDLTPPSQDENGKTVLHRLPYFTRHCPLTRDIVLSDRILSIGKGLIGPDSWLLEDTMGGAIWQLKKGGKRSAYSSIRWHIDFGADHFLVPVASAGIYLDASTAENGCLAVVPGSHRFPPTKLPTTPLLIEAQPGDIICHADRIFHGSGPVIKEGGRRATLYLYFCGGEYPGPGIPFAPAEKKAAIKQLFQAAPAGG